MTRDPQLPPPVTQNLSRTDFNIQLEHPETLIHRHVLQPRLPAQGQETPQIRVQLDQYNPQILNRVMDNVRQLVTLRPTTQHHIQTLVQNREEGPPTATREFSLRGGQLQEIQPRQLQEAVAQESPPLQRGNLPQGRQGVMVPGEGREVRELTLFEKIFLARFKDGIPLGRALEKGEHCFRPKSEGDWKGFFQRVGDYLYSKTSEVKDIKEMIYRGLVGEKSQGQEGAQKPVLVSDVVFQSGKADKFTQMAIASQSVAKTLGQLLPGNKIGESLIQEMGIKGALLYQALSYKPVALQKALEQQDPMALLLQQQAKAAARAAEGMQRGTTALSAQAQQMAAEGLDMPQVRLSGALTGIEGRQAATDSIEGRAGMAIGGEIVEKREKKGLGRLFGFLWKKDKERGGEEAFGSTVFVPFFDWTLTRRGRARGRPKWYLALFWFMVIFAAVFAIVAFLRLL
ncbi:MAG: hypothetical protein A3F89_07765 [Deltaproteobacteria bacterium RIFCSPLOWO2_12_FULL_50_11]|nr:MAG: hypothetical protein A3F89_07765 [Deltaproteobacteria bacterium RIFCSPLOWO2_12_FULL_50_11]